MSERNAKRIYLDPIHQDITLDRSRIEEKLIIDLIDCKEFQRLRRIQQLGVSSFTFQGAEGSRFTHSVGVMYIALKLFNMLHEKVSPKNKEVFGQQKALLLAAALLHDIGHGPFSHVTEKIVGYNHEDWSCRIIGSDSEVHSILDAYSPKESLATKIVQVLKKEYRPKYISHLISSQLDCDRFDYLLRDSYMTGTAYGLFALHRILASLELDEEEERIVVGGEKGQPAVEDYLFARYSMYSQVYYHRKNLAARALLAKLINRARYLFLNNGKERPYIDGPTHQWLIGKELTVDQYLFLDDVQLTYHIKHWACDSDPILADLAKRFLHRRIFKAIKIAREHFNSLSEVEVQAQKIAASAGFDPEYYIAIESTGFRPYEFYKPDSEIPQTNIMVRTETGTMQELSQISLTINALVKGNFEAHWLIFPSELSDQLKPIRALVPQH